MKFTSCLAEIEKTAGFGDAVKRLALTEVPGTKPWFIGAKKPASDSLKRARPGMSGTRTAVRGGPGGAKTYDVSALAEQMGIK